MRDVFKRRGCFDVSKRLLGRLVQTVGILGREVFFFSGIRPLITLEKKKKKKDYRFLIIFHEHDICSNRETRFVREMHGENLNSTPQ